MKPPQAPLLDEGFFLYYEDADYSKQLENDGYRLLTTDCTRYYHKVGGSTSRNENIVTIQMKSMWRYYLKQLCDQGNSVLLRGLSESGEYETVQDVRAEE